MGAEFGRQTSCAQRGEIMTEGLRISRDGFSVILVL